MNKNYFFLKLLLSMVMLGNEKLTPCDKVVITVGLDSDDSEKIVFYKLPNQSKIVQFLRSNGLSHHELFFEDNFKKIEEIIASKALTNQIILETIQEEEELVAKHIIPWLLRESKKVQLPQKFSIF